MICSFLVNGIVFSIINTFGILFVKVRESWPPSAVFWKQIQLKEELKEAGDEDAAFKTCNVFFIKISQTIHGLGQYIINIKSKVSDS